jgi:NAD(P)-dependent dehydrogenase (short-subunit alcohol dehydrogenase family)
VTVADLHGSVALVTGSSSGIGAAIATAIARGGATVVVNSICSAARRDRPLQRRHQARLHRRSPGTRRPDASILAPGDPRSARGQTLSLFALLIGTLQLSRAIADRRLADEVPARGIENALAILPGE